MFFLSICYFKEDDDDDEDESEMEESDDEVQINNPLLKVRFVLF